LVDTESIFRDGGSWHQNRRKSPRRLPFWTTPSTVALKKEVNVCTAEVLAALDLLAAQATVKWPFDQFRRTVVKPATGGN
jgi:hypothetical protein